MSKHWLWSRKVRWDFKESNKYPHQRRTLKRTKYVMLDTKHTKESLRIESKQDGERKARMGLQYILYNFISVNAIQR